MTPAQHAELADLRHELARINAELAEGPGPSREEVLYSARAQVRAEIEYLMERAVG